MDITSIMKTMLSPESIAQMSKKNDTSSDKVKSVLLSALPAMLGGVQGQAGDLNTVAGFAGALDSHAKDDTDDVAAFLSNVDIKDGKKIVGHLLGGEKSAATKTAAKKAGLSTSAAGNILGTAAPLLMSLLGQQATQAAQTQSQAQNVFSSGAQQTSSGVGLLAGLVGGAQQHAPAHQSGIGGLLGSLFGGASQQTPVQQQSAASNPIGAMMGSMLGGVDVSSLLSDLLGSGK